LSKYDFAQFKEACQNPDNDKIYIRPKARMGAKRDFKIRPRKKILEFIAEGGLESCIFIKTVEWNNNPNPDPIYIDSYSFYSGEIFGYVAFFFNDVTNMWVLKSFKKNKDSDPRKNLEDITSVSPKIEEVIDHE